MKKAKNSSRVISLALVLAMLLTFFAMAVNVSAEGDTPTPAPEVVPDELIDLDRDDGTITVTKYVRTAELDPIGGNATGTEADAAGINAAYSTMEGAEFLLVKIYDADTVSKYYSGLPMTTPPVLDGTLSDISVSGSTATAWTVKYNGTTISNTDSKSIFKGTTDENGVFAFEGLEVGFYYLKEISSPDQVPESGRCVDSIISLPMVNTMYASGTTGSDNGGSDAWLYDISVFPKNLAQKGEVTITKQDTLGAGLNNVFFELYRADIDEAGELGDWTKIIAGADYNDAETGVAAYKTATVTAEGESTDGVKTITGLEAGSRGSVYKLVEIFVEGQSPNGYIVDANPIYFSIDKDRIMHWGAPTELGLSNTDFGDRFPGTDPDDEHNVTDNTKLAFTLRNEKPTLTKEVAKNLHNSAASASEWMQDEQYEIGEEITYRLTVYVPRNVEKLPTFKIVDTPDAGITDSVTAADFTVTYGTADTALSSGFTVSTVAAAEADAEAGTAAHGQGFQMTFSADALALIKGQTIHVTYKAKLNSKAVIAGNGNANYVDLIYSRVFEEGVTDEPEYTIEDTTKVYTYKLQLTKHSETIDGTVLPNVEFVLLDAAKKQIGVVKIADGHYRVAAEGETAMTDNMKTDSTGKILIDGVENTKYFLKEMKTVAGYNLLSEPFEVNVAITETTTWNDGTSADTLKEEKLFGSVTYTKTATESVDIINKKGFVLPQTGSMGYLLFCTAGVLLILGGGALMFSGRKKVIR